LLDSAVTDLKECTSINSDYAKELGAVYEKIGQKDSAIKYYELFLTDYPDSLAVRKAIFNLKNGS
jgi:hypothetical protein